MTVIYNVERKYGRLSGDYEMCLSCMAVHGHRHLNWRINIAIAGKLCDMIIAKPGQGREVAVHAVESVL